MSPSPRGFDAYCRKAENGGGTVERICVALDVGLEMHDAFDARRPDGPTRLAVVLPSLRTWIAQKAALAKDMFDASQLIAEKTLREDIFPRFEENEKGKALARDRPELCSAGGI